MTPAMAQGSKGNSSASSLSTPPSSETVAEAGRHFERGVAYVNQESDPASALVEFRESSRLYPTFSAALNAAACLKALGRHAEALAALDGLRADFRETLSPTQKQSVAVLRDRLLERVGELDVRVQEPECSIVIDGVQRGTSPLASPLHLDVGVHMLRVSKDGFQTTEQQVAVIAGRRQLAEPRMSPLVGVGTLEVSEASGAALDLFVDGALVGRTPWRGNVATGLHSLQLRSDGYGTALTPVDVRLRTRSVLTLRRVRLDAEVAIEPDPLGAGVYVDGVFAGNGTWLGSLPAGPHRFEVVAPGYLPFKRELRLSPGKRERVSAQLSVAPRALPERPSLGLSVEPSLGVLFARSLRGSADEACDCRARSRPLGFAATVRVGYGVYRQLGAELAVGYVRVHEGSTRREALSSDPGGSGFHTDDFQDTLTLAGPFALLGLGLRSRGNYPITARLSGGLALLWVDADNSGTARGTLQDGTVTVSASGHLSMVEPTHRLLTPLVSTELRVGRYLSRHLSADLGVSLTLFVPPSVQRTGRSGLASGEQAHDIGALGLPDERLARPFLAIVPSVAGRFDL